MTRDQKQSPLISSLSKGVCASLYMKDNNQLLFLCDLVKFFIFFSVHTKMNFQCHNYNVYMCFLVSFYDAALLNVLKSFHTLFLSS